MLRKACLLFSLLVSLLFSRAVFSFQGGLQNETNLLAADFAASFKVLTKSIDLSLGGQFGLNELNGERKRGYGAFADVDYKLLRWLELYASGGHELRERFYYSSAGLGAKFTYLSLTNVDLSVSAMPQYAWETPEGGATVGFVRLSFRHRIKLSFLEDRLRLTSIVFYKPALLTWSDFIVTASHGLSVKVAKPLSLNLTHELYYKFPFFQSKLRAGVDIIIEGNPAKPAGG
jgi:hypothetical protein